MTGSGRDGYNSPMATKKLHLITAIVQHSIGNQVLDAALQAGATGATYFYAQGTGVRQALGPAGQEIEVNKRVIHVLSDPAKSSQVLDAIVAAARLNEPGQGLAFIQEVHKAVGLVAP